MELRRGNAEEFGSVEPILNLMWDNPESKEVQLMGLKHLRDLVGTAQSKDKIQQDNQMKALLAGGADVIKSALKKHVHEHNPFSADLQMIGGNILQILMEKRQIERTSLEKKAVAKGWKRFLKRFTVFNKLKRVTWIKKAKQ